MSIPAQTGSRAWSIVGLHDRRDSAKRRNLVRPDSGVDGESRRVQRPPWFDELSWSSSRPSRIPVRFSVSLALTHPKDAVTPLQSTGCVGQRIQDNDAERGDTMVGERMTGYTRLHED
ncbi:hypothetical protein KM043_017205 [Ampulex compressa]|nr:hypothetical protein KM043_017205 [Ampulex compressa]